MSYLQKSFLRIINDLIPDAQERRFLLAISGGVDSMVMASLFNDAKLDFAIAHCNFKLRGKASDADQALVEEFASKTNKSIFVNHFETQKYAHEKGISTQMAARELRYEWFEEVLAREKFDFLVLAQHANDNLETALFNFVKGTGIAGLRGMIPLREKILRPLLTIMKEDLLRYADMNQIKWREDSSNSNNKYHRNFIRNQVVKQLVQVNPNLVTTYVDTAKRLRGIDSIIERQIISFENKHTTNHIFQLTFDEVKQETNSHLFVELLLRKGFDLSTIESFLKSSSSTTGQYISCENLMLWKERDCWVLKEAVRSENESVTINLVNQTITIGELTIETEKVENVSLKAVKSDLSSLYLDIAKWAFPLELRRWQKGDRIQPFGMKGTKLISDILIDQKVPAHLKKDQYVLVSEDEILAVIGLKTSEKLRFEGEINGAFKIYFNRK